MMSVDLWRWLKFVSVETSRPSRRPARLQLEVLEERTVLNGGAVDPTFGTGGIVHSEFLASSFSPSPLKEVLQPDGKILVAGIVDAIYSDSPVPGGMGLARYNTDGTPDPTFGDHGIVFAPDSDPRFGSFGFDGASLALQSDGKIVIALSGFRDTLNGSGEGYTLARFNADGTLDTTFQPAQPSVSPDGFYVSAITLQSDSKIVVVGGQLSYSLTSTNRIVAAASRPFLARYNADGSLDTTFNPTGQVPGTVTTTFPSVGQWIWSSAKSVLVQPDGRIVVGESASDFPMSAAALVRYNADGSLDQGFGQGGKVILDDPSGQRPSDFESLALQPDGKIVAAGGYVLARYNADGSLDVGFGSGGTIWTGATLFIRPGYFNDFAQIVVQPDGKIDAVGTESFWADEEYSPWIRLEQFNPDGSLDPGFGTGGVVFTGADSLGVEGDGVVLQGDGKLVVVGRQGGHNPDRPGFYTTPLLTRYLLTDVPGDPPATPADTPPVPVGSSPAVDPAAVAPSPSALATIKALTERPPAAAAARGGFALALVLPHSAAGEAVAPAAAVSAPLPPVSVAPSSSGAFALAVTGGIGPTNSDPLGTRLLGGSGDAPVTPFGAEAFGVGAAADPLALRGEQAASPLLAGEALVLEPVAVSDAVFMLALPTAEAPGRSDTALPMSEEEQPRTALLRPDDGTKEPSWLAAVALLATEFSRRRSRRGDRPAACA
jgi:uncharacterized delta-60 repeat protein